MIGLSKEEIVDQLGTYIKQGETIIAKDLKNVIADVIISNNKKIEEEISTMLQNK